jgi:hypothetical protein
LGILDFVVLLTIDNIALFGVNLWELVAYVQDSARNYPSLIDDSAMVAYDNTK